MKRYIITWNIGYGDYAEVVEAEDLEKATMIAYEAAREAFENNASYDAEEYTQERAEELEV